LDFHEWDSPLSPPQVGSLVSGDHPCLIPWVSKRLLVPPDPPPPKEGRNVCSHVAPIRWPLGFMHRGNVALGYWSELVSYPGTFRSFHHCHPFESEHTATIDFLRSPFPSRKSMVRCRLPFFKRLVRVPSTPAFWKGFFC